MFSFYTIPLLLVFVSCTHAQSKGEDMAPPSNLGRPYGDADQNKTMDEIITGALGGPQMASHYIMSDGGQILAELDMYLTEQQFLNMYEPPKPEEMEKMGIYSSVHSDPSIYSDNVETRHGVRSKRKATASTNVRWKDAVMPFRFAKGHFDEKEEYMMRRSMTEWERYTCVKFRPSTRTDKNSVRFQNGVGCNSQLGMVGGIQTLNLQAPGCRYKGLYLHEIGHALGLVHEHQLPDRDNYIEILYHNVSPHMRIWFQKYTPTEVNQMSVPYEYSSVMHYGITAFSMDGRKQTIRAKYPSKEADIGKVYLKELAYTDVAIVNKMYHCAANCPDLTKCGPEGHVDQNCNCICKDGSSDCDKTRKQPADAACQNRYDSWSCYIWANQGECDRNSFYMHEHCAKACGQCGPDKTKKERKKIPITWTWQWLPMFANMFPHEWNVGNDVGAPCKDIYSEEKCRVWQERGDCITNKFWMKKSCPITCDLCQESVVKPEVNCENRHQEKTDCDDWAKEGECMVNRDWMNLNCQRSCYMCHKDVTGDGTKDTGDDGGGGGGGDEDELECVDTNHDCAAWAKVGECQTNPNWMIQNCRKACQKCDDGTCKNLFDDKQCEIWAQKFECVANSKWMGLHCAKSCGRGVCEGSNPQSTSSPRVTPRPGRTTPKVTSFCQNKHNSDTECEVWAKNDHCDINPGWMKAFCAKACDECSNAQSDQKTTRKPKSNRGQTSVACRDERRDCPAWARDGYCETNAAFNLKYCKLSCHNCNGCRDLEFLCGVWAKSGHCQKNARYMLRQCQKSCNACKL